MSLSDEIPKEPIIKIRVDGKRVGTSSEPRKMRKTDKIEVKCTAYGFGNSTLSWYREDAYVKKQPVTPEWVRVHSQNRKKHKQSSDLLVSGFKYSDEGLYVCWIEDPSSPGQKAHPFRTSLKLEYVWPGKEDGL